MAARLLVVIPKQMHWNAFRFCIGPFLTDGSRSLMRMPSHSKRYMVWTGNNWGKFVADYDSVEMTSEYSEWMQTTGIIPAWPFGMPPTSRGCRHSQA